MRAELVPALLVSLLACVVGAGVMHSSGARRHRPDAPLALRASAGDDGSPRATPAAAPPAAGPQPTPAAELRRRVSNLASGTYVADILMEQDSVLYRWPDRLDNAVRVYVDSTTGVADWSARYPGLAREVCDEWSLAGFPLRFNFIFDSTSADITIRWIDRFPADAGQRIGETLRTQTSASLISHAQVVIANHDSTGRPLPADVVAGILRHEVGHALGLNHANDPTSVMFRDAATSTISTSDRATLRMLYLVPPGSLR